MWLKVFLLLMAMVLSQLSIAAVSHTTDQKSSYDAVVSATSDNIALNSQSPMSALSSQSSTLTQSNSNSAEENSSENSAEHEGEKDTANAISGNNEAVSVNTANTTAVEQDPIDKDDTLDSTTIDSTASANTESVAAGDSSDNNNNDNSNDSNSSSSSVPAETTAANAPLADKSSDEAKPEEPRFGVWEYQVTGNTVLPAKILERALTPYLGAARTVSDVLEAAKQLERVYRDQGYPAVYVNLPEQDVVGGKVLLEVVEGRVDRLRVVNSQYHTLSDIKRDLKSVQRGQTLYLPGFQRDLGIVNARSANLRVTPILKPGRTPGDVDIDIKVKDKLPLSGAIELNNHNSNNTTRERLSFNIGYENLWQRDHSLSLQLQSSPSATEEVKVSVLTYLMPILNRIDRLAIYGVRSDSEVATVDELSVVGNGRILGMRYVKPLSSTRAFVHTLSLGFDYKDFDDTIESTVVDDATQEDGTLEEPNEISYGMWVLNYSVTTQSAKVKNKYTVGVNLGMRNSLNGESEFANKRFLAQPNFFYGHASFKQTYRLPKDWQFKTRIKLQVADSPLISNEQFSLGGNSSVRSYHESQIFGDDGINIGFEVRTPKLFDSSLDFLKEFRLLSFVEGAYAKIKKPLGDQEDEIDIGGAGIGFRVKGFEGLQIAADAAVAFTDSKDIESGDLRVNARLKYSF